jgi:hypothetical protein
LDYFKVSSSSLLCACYSLATQKLWITHYAFCPYVFECPLSSEAESVKKKNTFFFTVPCRLAEIVRTNVNNTGDSRYLEHLFPELANIYLSRDIESVSEIYGQK